MGQAPGAQLIRSRNEPKQNRRDYLRAAFVQRDLKWSNFHFIPNNRALMSLQANQTLQFQDAGLLAIIPSSTIQPRKMESVPLFNNPAAYYCR